MHTHYPSKDYYNYYIPEDGASGGPDGVAPMGTRLRARITRNLLVLHVTGGKIYEHPIGLIERVEVADTPRIPAAYIRFRTRVATYVYLDTAADVEHFVATLRDRLKTAEPEPETCRLCKTTTVEDGMCSSCGHVENPCALCGTPIVTGEICVPCFEDINPTVI